MAHQEPQQQPFESLGMVVGRQQLGGGDAPQVVVTSYAAPTWEVPFGGYATGAQQQGGDEPR